MPLCRIEGERRDHVVQRALDVGQAPHAAVPRVERADVLDDAGIPKRAVQDAGRLVVVHARNRAERARDKLALWRDRELADLREIASLELVLERDPLLPRLLQRQAEYLLGTGPRSSARFLRRVPSTRSACRARTCRRAT